MSDKIKVINAMQEHELLFNKKHDDFKSKTLKEQAWIKIEEESGLQGKYVFILSMQIYVTSRY